MSPKKKEVLSHPKVVKLMSVISAIFIIGTMAWNGIQFGSAFLLDWGFYNPSQGKFVPDIQAEFNNVTMEATVSIPCYVNNTAMIGFPVSDLRVDFNINYQNGTKILNQSNVYSDIPHGDTLQFNVTLIETNALSAVSVINSTAIELEILFNVHYIVTTVNFELTIELPGGLSFS